MKFLTKIAPLNVSQIHLVLELLDMHMLAPQETAQRFYQASRSATFSQAQLDAVELLFELDDDQVANALLTFADDDACDLVREQVAHEAQLHVVTA
jgi:hypothetical protein